MNIPFKWCFDIANIYIFNSISTKIKLIINSILELLNYCSPLIFFIIKDKINNQVASTLFEKINAYIKQVYAVLYSVLILTLLTRMMIVFINLFQMLFLYLLTELVFLFLL